MDFFRWNKMTESDKVSEVVFLILVVATILFKGTVFLFVYY